LTVADRTDRHAREASCRIGRCGTCLVLLNGNAVNACLLMAWQIDAMVAA
jgi:aerobic carbon-monoxide dehydrogenase small subunit